MERRSTEHDFYGMGQRHAKKYFDSLVETAETIEKNFGKDARLDFECGVANVVSVYSVFQKQEVKTDSEGYIRKQM